MVFVSSFSYQIVVIFKLWYDGLAIGAPYYIEAETWGYVTLVRNIVSLVYSSTQNAYQQS